MEYSPSLGIQVMGVGMEYVDRGDPAVPDFTKASFTIDGAWHSLDLSAIVPAGGADNPVFLALKAVLQFPAPADSLIQFREVGNINNYNVAAHVITIVALDAGTVYVSMDSSRVIEYNIQGALDWYSLLDITVRGWLEG